MSVFAEDVAACWQRDGRGWWLRRDDASVTVARRLPLRWDVSARSTMPDLGRRRLAHAVRQDLWRALRRLRGFAPAVEVTRRGRGLDLRAGGQVDGSVPPGLESRIAAILADPWRRAEWLRAATHRGAG